ncbi:MAG: PQQ-binding-like beta-propeller repeat protein [Planctomycetota bacterium]
MAPVVVGGLVVCRRDDGVVAYDLTGERTGAGGGMVWTSLPLPVAGSGSWLGSPYAWFADASAYSITSDGRRAFVVGRLPSSTPTSQPADKLVPAADRQVIIRGMGMMMEGFPGAGEEPSALVALSLEEEGKILWSVGGGAGDGGDASLRSARFPSAPAVQDGRLYAAAVLNDTIYLVCLDTAGLVQWKAPIADSLGGNPAIRRYRPPSGPAGASIALADGMVFVCTNTGVLACVDAESGQALWARQYVDANTLLTRSRGGFAARPGGLGGNLNPLLVLDGKVICLPGDVPTLMAVSAADGKLLWSRPCENQTELSAIDTHRVLLSSPGLSVMDVATGGVLSSQPDLGLRGRPAVGPTGVIAGGQGQLVRMDLKSYAITRTNLASPEAMLGNLVAVGGRLVAANASGLYAYVNYDDHRGELDRRLAGAQVEARPKVLVARGRLSCNAGRFEDALADLKAALEQVGGSGELADAAREWQMRTYVARGDRRERASDMAADFQLAYDVAGTPARQAQMLVRLAKARRMAGVQAVGDEAGKLEALRQAVEAAHRLAESFKGEKVADVPVGAVAVSQPPEILPMADGRAWAMATFLPALLKENGRACYAAWDAQADQALAQALAAADTPAMLAVRDRWPNSMHVPRALISAAEGIYRRQTAGSTLDEEEMERAYGLLADAEDRADPRAVVTSLAGRAVIAARRSDAGPLGWILAQQIRDVCAGAGIPLTEPVAFNQSDKPLTAMLKELGEPDPAAAAPAPEASLSAPVEPSFVLKGDSYLVRDQAWQGVRQGTNVLAIRDDKLVWLDTAAASIDKAVRWEVKVPFSFQSALNSGASAGFTLVGALAPDGKTILVADRTWALALNVADGTPCWKEPVNIGALVGGPLHSMAVGDGRLLVQDHRGRLTCLEGRDGKVSWKADLGKELTRFDVPPQIAGRLALLQGGNYQKVACVDLRTGKVRGLWSSGQPISARLLPCGLAAVLADGTCSLYSMAGSSPVTRAIWTRSYKVEAQPAIVGADRDRIFISDNGSTPTLDVIRLDNKPMHAVKLTGGSGPVCAVQPDGGALYLTVGRNVQGGRGARLYMGQMVVQSMSVHKVDAATGRELWKNLPPLASMPASASFPIVPAGATVAVTVGAPAYGTNMSVSLLGASDGGRIQSIELSPNPNVNPQVRDRGMARLRCLGPAQVVGGRLCVEDVAGITVYRPKIPAPEKP